MVIIYKYILISALFYMISGISNLNEFLPYEENQIKSLVDLMEKYSYKGYWILEKNRTINHFENNHGLILINMKRYNITSNMKINEYIKFIIKLYDGNYSNKWLQMIFYGLTFNNSSYDFEKNIFKFKFNTSKVELGELFESNIYLLSDDFLTEMKFSYRNKPELTNITNHTEKNLKFSGNIYSNSGMIINFTVDSDLEINNSCELSYAFIFSLIPLIGAFYYHKLRLILSDNKIYIYFINSFTLFMDIIWNAYGFCLNFYYASIFDSYVQYWIPGILYFFCFANQGLVLFVILKFQNPSRYKDSRNNHSQDNYYVKFICLLIFALLFAEKFYFKEIYTFIAIVATWLPQITHNYKSIIVNYSLPLFYILLISINRIIFSLYLSLDNAFMYKSNSNLFKIGYIILILEIIFIYYQYSKARMTKNFKEKNNICNFCSLGVELEFEEKHYPLKPIYEKIKDFFFNFQRINYFLVEGVVIENCKHICHLKCFVAITDTKKCFSCNNFIENFKIVYY